MKIYKVILYFLFAIFLNSCQNNKKNTVENQQHKTIEGDFIENQEASDLNEEGIELSKNGNYEAGKKVFLKALELEPDNPTTLSNLGLNRFLVHEYDNAINYYQKSYKISDSTYHTAAINLGLTYYYKKEFSKGIAITNYVIEHTTDSQVLSTAYVHRALNYIGNKECDKAQSDLNHIIKNYKGMGNVEYNTKDLTEKIKNCVEQRV